jgi:hypothetical protein
MVEDDRSYYQYRVEVEARRAQEATVPSVVQAHLRFADAYREKLSSNELFRAEPS